MTLAVPTELMGQSERRELSEEVKHASRLVLVDTDARVVRGLTYEREALRISVETGTIGFAVDHQMRTRGAVINGNGSLEFLPPTRLERDHLRRLKGDTVLRKTFSSVVLVFGDSTRQQLERFSQGPGFGSDVREPWEQALPRLGSNGLVNDPVMVKTYGERRTSDWCWAYFDVTDGDPLMYYHVPFAEEEVHLSEYIDSDAAEIVSSFHRAADYSLPESERFNAARFLRVDRVTIDGTFSDQTFKSDYCSRRARRLHSDRTSRTNDGSHSISNATSRLIPSSHVRGGRSVGIAWMMERSSG